MFRRLSWLAILWSAACASPPASDRAPAVVFERNIGQAPDAFRYVARTASYDLAFADDRVTFALKDAAGTATVTLRFDGAVPRHAFGDAPLHSRVPAYGRVRYAQLYDGIDAVFYGSDARVEYDFIVAPHADPAQITLQFEGAEAVDVTQAGDLVVRAGGRDLVQRKPTAYQQKNGARLPVSASYRHEKGRLYLNVGTYDPTLPLVIDPVVMESRLRAVEVSRRAVR